MSRFIVQGRNVYTTRSRTAWQRERRDRWEDEASTWGGKIALIATGGLLGMILAGAFS